MWIDKESYFKHILPPSTHTHNVASIYRQSNTDSAISRSLTWFLSGDAAKKLFSDLISAAVTEALTTLTMELNLLKAENADIRNELAKYTSETDSKDQAARRNNLIVTSTWPDTFSSIRWIR